MWVFAQVLDLWNLLSPNDCVSQPLLRESSSLSRENLDKVKTLQRRTSYIFQLVAHERRLSTSASRTMAAMSLGFIVMVTPWTIQEVVAACTGSKPPPFLDFLATWLALSNSFWNPFLYWLLNNHFRRISRELLYTKVNINVPFELNINDPLVYRQLVKYKFEKEIRIKQ